MSRTRQPPSLYRAPLRWRHGVRVAGLLLLAGLAALQPLSRDTRAERTIADRCGTGGCCCAPVADPAQPAAADQDCCSVESESEALDVLRGTCPCGHPEEHRGTGGNRMLALPDDACEPETPVPLERVARAAAQRPPRVTHDVETPPPRRESEV